MATHASFPPMDETAQERLLRASLQCQADVEIDTEQAWARVVPRLSDVSQPQHSSYLFARAESGRRRGAFNRLPPLVAVALVAVFLLSAGLATGISQWAHLSQTQALHATHPQSTTTIAFQPIGERQESNGVTLIVESAHADATQSLIKYSVPLQSIHGKTDDMIALAPPTNFIVNGQKETLTATQNKCDRDLVRQIMHCLMVLSPVHTPEHTGTLHITWEFSSVTLQRPHLVESQRGYWQFHFSLPFQG